MMNGHLSEGTLRALADGELSPLSALRCTLHLSRCSRCRRRRGVVTRLHEHASTLLAQLDHPVESDEGWARLRAVRPDAASRRLRLVAFPLVAGAVAVMVGAMLVAGAHEQRSKSAHDPVTAAAVSRRDLCCWDLDGGGRGDDGVLTLSRAGEQVDCVVLYDDVDGSNSLTPGDIIRYVSSAEACGLAGGNPPSRLDENLIESPHRPMDARLAIVVGEQ